MRQIDYTDDQGRTWRVELPDGSPDADAPRGLPVGPPPVADELGLPEPWATRMHNELHRRGLFSLADVRRRPADVHAALIAALRVDVQRIMAVYEALERQGQEVR